MSDRDEGHNDDDVKGLVVLRTHLAYVARELAAIEGAPSDATENVDRACEALDRELSKRGLSEKDRTTVLAQEWPI